MAEWTAPTAEEIAKQWQDEMERNVRRFQNGLDLLTRGREPRLGQTPREAIYRTNKSILYRYGPQAPKRHAVPVLFVPNLGISRPYIFDLMPGSSFVEHMVQQGFDFYLLDWGVFGDEDNGLTVDECVTRILPKMVRKLLQRSEAEGVNLLGYCMGGPLAAAYAALYPEPVKTLINMAGPIDYAQAGVFTTWLDARYYDVDKLVDTFGSMPADLVRAGFKMLRPTMDLTTYGNLWWNLWNEKYVEGYLALNRWANEYVPFPGEFFRQWVKEFYQANKLIKGELSLGGQPVRLSAIRCPLFVVGAKHDYICPPKCARARMDAVESTDKQYMELPGGHISLIAGRSAARQVWPRVSAWLAERSN